MLQPVPREHLGTQIVILERRPPSRWIIHEWYPMVPMWKKGSKWFRILGSWDILGWQSNGWYLAYNHYIHSIYPILTVLVISCQLHPITTRRLWKAGHLIAPQPINHGDLEKKSKNPTIFQLQYLFPSVILSPTILPGGSFSVKKDWRERMPRLDNWRS